MAQIRTRKGKTTEARLAQTGDTDERGVEEALRQERDRAQQYLDIAGVMFVAIDRDERVSLANLKCCEVLGYEAGDVIGRNWFEIFLPVGVRAEVRAVFSQLMAGDIPPAEYFENPVVTRSGEERTIAWHNALLRDEAGRICGTLSSGEDVTERKRAEEALRESERRYRLLADNVTDLIWTTDLKLHATHASPSISRLLGYTVEEAMALNLKEALTPASFDLVREVYAEEISGKSVEHMDPHRSRRMELEVIRKDGSVIWVEADMTFLRDPNGRAVGVLGVSRDVTERKRAEEALRESEEKYRRLVEDSLDGIVIARGLEVVFANRAVLEVLGLQSEEEIIGRPFTDFVSPDHRELMVERGLARERGGSFPARYEFKGLRADGTEVDAEISAGSIVYEGNVARQGIIRDITERKRMEEALRESERHYRLLAENVTDVIWTADLNLNLTYISPSAKRLWGYSVEERMAMRLQDILTPASLEVARKAFVEAMRAERQGNISRPHTQELEVRRKDGFTGWGEVTVTFLRDPDGRPVGILGVSREITERKRAQEALRASESRYRLLAENATDVIWTTDMDINLTYVSPSVEQMWGYTAEERMGMRLEEMLAPASLELAKSAFRETLAIARKGGRAPSKPRTVELEVRREDGSGAWAEVKVTVLRDLDGRPMGLLGASRDVTERVRTQEALRESEGRFRTLAESAPAAIFIFQGRKVLYVNPMAEAISGYTRDELLALDLLDLLRPEFQKRLTELGEARLRGNRDAVRVEFEFIRKDGEARWADVTADAIEYGGEVAGIGVAYDITERKRAEEALRQSEARFRTLADTTPAAIFAVQGTKFRYANRMAEALTGYSADELLTMDFWDVVHPESRELVRERGLARQQGEDVPSRYEFKMVAKNGDECWVDFTAATLELEGSTANIGIAYDVTKRKRAEEALRQSEARFRKLADSAPAAVFIYRGTRPLFVNAAMEELTGYAENEILARELWQFVHADFQDLARERSRARQEGEEAPSRYELKIVRKSGEERWVDFTAAMIEFEGEPAALGTAYDITERKHAEEALRESEERARLIVETALDAFVSVDVDGLIVAWNSQAEALFGWSRSEALGRPLAETIIPVEYRGAFGRGLKRLLATGESALLGTLTEVTALRRDGREFPVELMPWQAGMGDSRRFNAFVRDITERKQAEEALQKARDELENRVEREIQRGSSYSLTFRELTVLHLVAAGKADKEIAFELGISPLTASKHIANILSKMNAASRTEAGVRALREGLLD